MARILFVLVMILMMNKQAISFDIFGFSFEDFKEMYEYMSTMYETAMNYTKKIETTEEAANTTVLLHEIVSELREVTKRLDYLQTHEDDKIKEVANMLLKNIEIMTEFRSVKDEFLGLINDVEYWFGQGMEYENNAGYSVDALHSFVNGVLWDTNKLDRTLFKIDKLIHPGDGKLFREGYTTLALENAKANYERLCDKNISPQQHIYYIFKVLIQTELKAFTTVTQAYSIQSSYKRANSTIDYKAFAQNLQQRLKNYFEFFIDTVTDFPSDIRRCNMVAPKIGTDAIELERLFQVLIEYESRLKQTFQSNNGYEIYGGCEDMKERHHRLFTPYNCKSYVDIHGCSPVKNNGFESPERFLWFTADSETFGQQGSCDSEHLGDVVRTSPVLFRYDDVCLCLYNYSIHRSTWNAPYTITFEQPKIIYISSTPQLSDIANNMVVSGVRFIVLGNVLYLQIKQYNISGNASLNSGGEWKPLNVHSKSKDLDYIILYDKRNILYLDDVTVHPDYIVTGIRFQVTKDDRGIELHVHSAKYNHTAGQLGEQKWFVPGEYHSDNNSDYNRERMEVQLYDSDDPTRYTNYYPDPNTNKFVQFQISSLKKDAGYHTIPFIDAQPVEVLPVFPLGGIGLFHRTKDGFGGYVAPRLITHDVSSILKSARSKWNKWDTIFAGNLTNTNVTKGI